METDQEPKQQEHQEEKQDSEKKEEQEKTEETKKEEEAKGEKTVAAVDDAKDVAEVKKEEEEVKAEEPAIKVEDSAAVAAKEEPKKEEKEEEDKVKQEVKILVAPLPEGAVKEALDKKEEEEDKENKPKAEEEVEEEEEEEEELDEHGLLPPVMVADAVTQTRKPPQRNRGVTAYPDYVNAGTQTDGPVYPPVLPLPCPMWMPVPFGMYTTPKPEPVPVPLPVPVPVFLPTTRRSYRGIRKQIRRVVARLPPSQLEVELLKLSAELTGDRVAGVDYYDSADSDADEEFDEEDESEMNNGGQPAKPGPMDLEKDVRGDRVLPKALPQVTPDPAISPGPHAMRQAQQEQVLMGA